MKRVVGLVLTALAAMPTLQATAQVGPVSLYEDFASPLIDPGRWVEGERDRRVVLTGTNRWFTLTQADWGLTSSNAGRAGYSWSEELSRGAAVTQLRATVRVDSLEITACNANTTPTRVRARLAGTFFNTGNRSLGSYVGDVLAQIFVTRDTNSTDPPGVLRVRGAVSLCATSDCNPTASSPFGIDLGVVNLGTVALNTNVVLQMEWDRVNKKFLFTRDPGTALSVSGEVSYTVSDDSDPGRRLMVIGTRTEPANCTSPRTVARISARFDNVQVNSKAKP